MRMEAVQGIYVPKEKRIAKKLETDAAHFRLGTDLGKLSKRF